MGKEISQKIVTSLNDIVYIEKEHSSEWSGSQDTEALVLLEGDAGKQEHKPPTTLAFASSSQYDHSSGEDTYSIQEIANLREDGGTLSWEIRSIHIQENESTSYCHRDERITEYKYDLLSKRFVKRGE